MSHAKNHSQFEAAKELVHKAWSIAYAPCISCTSSPVLFGEHYIDDKLKPDDLVSVFDRLLEELELTSITE